MLRFLTFLGGVYSIAFGLFLLVFVMRIAPFDWFSVATGAMGTVLVVSGAAALLNETKF